MAVMGSSTCYGCGSTGSLSTESTDSRVLVRLYLNWDNRTVRRVLAADEKPLHWIGSSKRDFLSFPAAVKEDMGNALGIAQFGGTAPTAKPWKRSVRACWR
jgi:hypothetical protein